MKRLFVPLILVFSLSSFARAEAGLALGMQDAGRVLHIWVVNDSDASQEVNRRFLLGLLERGADVELQVFDTDGRQLQMTSSVEAASLRPDDVVVLRPNQIVGRIVDKCFLADDFSLVAGRYNVTIRYSPTVEWLPFGNKAYITINGEISIPSECAAR